MLCSCRDVEGSFRLSVRGMAAATILSLVAHMVSPAVLAAKAERQFRERVALPAASADQAVATHLTDVQHLLAEIHGEPPGPSRGLGRSEAPRALPLHAPAQQRRIARLRALAEELGALEADSLESFQRTEEHLHGRGLPREILERHEQAVSTFQQNMQALRQHLKRVKQSDDAVELEESLRDTHGFMRDKQQKRSHQHLDPDNLPFGTPRPVEREPGRTSFELQASLFGTVHLASADAMPVGLQGVQLTTEAPNAADLAPTPDAPITPAIQAQADALDNDPLAIFNWVHNTVEYLPTFGSIQGAEGVLNTRRGNGFDTASLLIALLRASEIPARYRHGTIRVPVDEAMNWVGGVETPEAAMELLGQGGVPNAGLTEGGVIRYIELEHAWAEAWLPQQPGRGAGAGGVKAWTPLDAAFKQYDYTSPVAFEEVVPFDTEAFAVELLNRSTVNESEGWVRGIDAGYIQQEFDAYQAQLESFLASELPDATLADVIGRKSIRQGSLRALRLGHPYQVVARGAAIAVLPDSLRHKFRFTLNDQYGMDVLSFQRDTVELAGRRLALSFRPASQADEDTIASYLPDVEKGTGFDLDDLPTTLPGYLIQLVPQWTVDGEVVSEGPSFSMGTEIERRTSVWSPNQGWQLRDGLVTAGEYHAVGLNMQGMAAQDLKGLRASMEAANAQLEAGDFRDVSKHDAVGGLLQSTVSAYMAFNDAQDLLASRAAGIVHYRAPSFGNFSTNAQVAYWFGLPRDVRFPGLLMDIDQDNAMVSVKDGNSDMRTAYVKARGGRISANEHLVPERIFSTDENPANGVSAVKALAIAGSENQRIWTLSQGNIDTGLPQISVDADVRREIRAAVNAGKEVTVHEAPIRHHGWEGTGYVLLDPQTGSGAWKISGGANGGFLIFVGYLLSVVSNLTDLKTLLLTESQIELVKSYFLRYLSLASAVLDVIDVAAECAHARAGSMALAMTGLISALLLSILLASLFGPIGSIVIAGASIFFLPVLKAYLKRNYCN